MPIELIDKIKPKNGGSFALVDAEDVLINDDGARLADLINARPRINYSSGISSRPLQFVNTGANITFDFTLSISLFGGYIITVDRAKYTSGNTSSFSRVYETTTNTAQPSITIGVAEATGDYIYRVRATDKLGNIAKTDLGMDYIDFRVIMGSIKFTSTFDANIDNTLLSTDTANIYYTFSVTANAECAIKLQYQVTERGAVIDGTKWLDSTLLDVVTDSYGMLSLISSIKTDLVANLAVKFDSTGSYSLHTRILFNVIDNGKIECGESDILSTDLSVMAPNSIDLRILTPALNYTEVSNNTPVSIKVNALTNDINYQTGNALKLEYFLFDNNDTIKLSNSFNIYHNSPSIITLGKLNINDGDETSYQLKITVTIPGSTSQATIDLPIRVKRAKGLGTVIEEDGLLFAFSLDDPTKYNLQTSEWLPDIVDDTLNTPIAKLKIKNESMLTNPISEGGSLIYSPSSFGKVVLGETLYTPFICFNQAGVDGITVEAYFKSKCIGILDAKVLSMRPNTTASVIGASISYNDTTIDSGDASISYGLLEDSWQHVALVIDGNERVKGSPNLSFEDVNPYYTARIYLNGVLSKIINIDKIPSLDKNQLNALYPFIINGQATENRGEAQEKLTIEGQGYCEIKNIRCYRRGLTSSQVFNNYLCCLTDAEREHLVAKNSDTLPKIVFIRNQEIDSIDKAYFDKKALKTTTFNELNKITQKKRPKGDTSGFYSKDTLVNSTLWYSASDESEFQKIENVDVYLQGTSSLVYPVKNYQIKTFSHTNDGSRIKNPILPPTIEENDSSWIKDSVFTLKCDYMEQSHRNNTPTACYYEDTVLDSVINILHPGEPLEDYYSEPKRKSDSKYRDAINGFPCLVYYYDNPAGSENINSANLVKSNFSNFTLAGTFMFNIDKEGIQLGFELDNDRGERYTCVSYEGSTNSDYGAAAFMSFSRYNDVRKEQYNTSITDYSWKTTLDENQATTLNYIDQYIKVNDKYLNVEVRDAKPYAVLNTSPSTKWTIDDDGCIRTSDDGKSYSLALSVNNFNDAQAYETDQEDLIYFKLINSKLQTNPETGSNYYFTAINGGTSDLTYYSNRDEYIEATLEPRFSSIDEEAKDSDNHLLMYKKISDTIDWVDNATDDEFKAEFNDYFSYEYCMTYFLQMMAFTQVDNAGKNAMFDYWALGDYESPLYPRPYDMDTQMGEENTGYDIVPPSAEINPDFAPSIISGNLVGSDPLTKFVPNYNVTTSSTHNRYNHYNTKNSSLWKKFARVFHDDIVKCYSTLRSNGIYTVDNIMNAISSKTSEVIGETFYNSDAVSKYIDIKTNDGRYNKDRLYAVQGNRVARYERYLTERFIFLDTYFKVARDLNLSASFRAYATARHPVGIRVYTPQYIKIVIGTSDITMVAYADPSDTYELDGTTYPGTLFYFPISGKNKEIIIEGIGNIQTMDHFNALECGSYSIQNAVKLTELDLAYNTNVTTLTLGDNSYFRTLDLRGTSNLNSSIDVSKCSNLAKVILSDSAVQSIKLPPNTDLQELDLTRSKITKLEIDGSSTLTVNGENPSLKLDGCTELRELIIRGCPKITELDLSQFPKLEKLELSSNSNLNSVNLSQLKLTHLSISGENISQLTMTGMELVSQDLLDLSGLSNLISVNLNQASIRRINLPANLYRALDLSYSKVISINSNESGTYNFEGIKFTDDYNNFSQNLSLHHNTTVTHVINLSIKGNLSSKFQYDEKLVQVSNCTFTIDESTSTSISGMFAYCYALEDITNNKFENFNQVTAANNLFIACRIITFPSILAIIKKLSNCTNFNNFLYAAYQPTDDLMENNPKLYPNELPLDFFENTTKITTAIRCFDSTKFTRIQYNADASLLSPLTNLENADRMFSACSNLIYVPDNLLKWNYRLTSARSMFWNCNNLGDTDDETCILNSSEVIVPQNNELVNELVDIGGMFANCYNLGKFRSNDMEYTQSFANIFKNSPKLEYADAIFYNCFMLNPPLSEGMFNNNTKLKNLDFAFLGSIIVVEHNIPEAYLSYIPSNYAKLLEPQSLPEIFKGDNKLSELTSCRGMFAGCLGLIGNIESSFFENTTELSHVGFAESGPKCDLTQSSGIDYNYGITITSPGMFADTAIEEVDCECFNSLVKLTDCSMLFARTQLLSQELKVLNYKITRKYASYTNPRRINTSVEFKFDASRTNNITIKNVDNAFINCRNYLEDTSYMFINCSDIGHVTIEKLFEDCAVLKSTSYMFANNSNLISVISDIEGEKSLFKNLNNLVNVSGMFLNCRNLANSLDDFIVFNNCSQIQNCSQMFMLTAISGDIPNNLFQSCRSTLQDVSYMFADCTALEGVIKTGYAEVNDEWDPATDTFEYTVVERGLLSDCNNLRAVDHMFCNCSNIKGPIPADMFYSTQNYPNIVSLEGLFESCNSLGLDATDEQTTTKKLSMMSYENTSTMIDLKHQLYTRTRSGARNYKSVYPKVKYTVNELPQVKVEKVKVEDGNYYWSIGGKISDLHANENDQENPNCKLSPNGYWVVNNKLSNIQYTDEIVSEYTTDSDPKYLVPSDWLKACKNIRNIDRLFTHIGNIADIKAQVAKSHLIPLLEIPNDIFKDLKIESARYAFAFTPILGRSILSKNFLSPNYITDITGIFTCSKLYKLGRGSTEAFMYSANSNSKLKKVSLAFACFNGFTYWISDDNNAEKNIANSYFNEYFKESDPDSFYIYSNTQVFENFGPDLISDRFKLSTVEDDVRYAYTGAYNTSPVYEGTEISDKYKGALLVEDPTSDLNSFFAGKYQKTDFSQSWAQSLILINPALK